MTATVTPIGHARASFIDTMQPLTEAERRAWKAYLALPQRHWRAARAMFRRACRGDEPGPNILQFVSETGLDDPGLIDALDASLYELAMEGEVRR